MADKELNFLQKLKKGLCRPEDIEDYIDEWHDKMGAGVSISKYLGLTKKQYFDWIDNHSILNRFYNIERDKNKAASKEE